MEILVVDDDVIIALTLVKAIKKWGFQGTYVETGAAALEEIRKNKFDLVLLDIFLPDYKGYELIPHFKKQWPEIDIITMTGYNSRELEKEVRRYGILYYMFKPLSFEQLKSIIEHVVSKKSSSS